MSLDHSYGSDVQRHVHPTYDVQSRLSRWHKRKKIIWEAIGRPQTRWWTPEGSREAEERVLTSLISLWDCRGNWQLLLEYYFNSNWRKYLWNEFNDIMEQDFRWTSCRDLSQCLFTLVLGGTVDFSSWFWNNGPTLHPLEGTCEFVQAVHMYLVDLEEALNCSSGIPLLGALAVRVIRPVVMSFSVPAQAQ